MHFLFALISVPIAYVTLVKSVWQMHIYVALWTTISKWSLDILQHKGNRPDFFNHLPTSTWTFVSVNVDRIKHFCVTLLPTSTTTYPFLCHGCNHWKSPFIGCEITQCNCCDILHLMRGQAISVHRPEYSAQGRILVSCEAILEENDHNISFHYFPVGAAQTCVVQWQNSWKRVSQQGGC